MMTNNTIQNADVEMPIPFMFKHPHGIWYIIIRQYLSGKFKLQIRRGFWDGEVCLIIWEPDRESAVKVKDQFMEAEDVAAWVATLLKRP
jgi:hypothetical protein